MTARARRIVLACYRQSRRAWARWRLRGMPLRRVPGPLYISREVMEKIRQGKWSLVDRP